jgi:hypothetical protein
MTAIKVNREELFGKLQSVQPGLTSKEVIDQSSCFIFVPGMVMTYNDEVSCRAPYGALHEFKGAVQAKQLLDLLGKLPEEDIEIEMDGTELLVTGIKRQAGFRMEAEVLSAAAGVEMPKEWSPLPENFAEALDVVAACAASDTDRFNMSCVHVHPRYIEACDNLQAARHRMRLGVEECLVKRSSLKQINTLGMTEIAQTTSWLHFRNANGLILSCRLYREESGAELYPPMSEVFEPESMEWGEVILPGGLAEEVTRAQIFSADANDDKVLVELRPGKIRIKGIGASGWFTATRRIEYAGPAMEFLIGPKLLVDVTKKANKVEVAPERLRIQGERYTYIALLSKKAGTNGQAQQDPEAAVAGGSETVGTERTEVPF